MSGWTQPRRERDAQIRDLWRRWYGLPSVARAWLGAFAATVVIVTVFLLGAGLVAVASAVAGNIGTAAGFILAAGLVVGTTAAVASCIPLGTADEDERRRRRTGEES